MGHELASYLAEFEGELASPRARGLALEPLLPGVMPSLPGASLPALVRALPPLYRQRAESVAEGLVREGVLPSTLPRGSTPLYIATLPPAPPTTAEAWVATMRVAHGEVRALLDLVARHRARGVAKTARGADPAAHIANNFEWREYRIPASGVCDPAELVWIDVWARAKNVLARMAAKPLRGVAPVRIRQWAIDVGYAVDMLCESTNIRWPGGPGGMRVPGRPDFAAFFDAPFTIAEAIGKSAETGYTPPRRTVRVTDVDDVRGLASTAQGNGGYYYDERANTAQAFEVMQYAPVPSGGYEELFTGTQRAWLRPKPVWTCLDAGHLVCLPYPAPGGALSDNGVLVADAAFAAWNATGQPSIDFSGPGRGGLPVRMRFDASAFLDNVTNLARVMSDPRLSLGAVFMRSMDFYVNAYLDFAGRRGAMATDVVNNARAAWAGIRAAANNTMNTVVSTYTGAIVAVITVINGAAGAIAGLVLGLLSALVSALGAAVGVGQTVVLPFYSRVYGGSCADSAWVPAAGTPPVTRPTPTATPEPEREEDPPPPPPEKKGGGVLAIGAIGLGLWLLAGKR